ncbi:type I-E CRISPR-associated protein Cas7/Cse4/CasC [Nocardia colli]|uniref:Type I-E CRISPR-associated protein Cas7/Cse4/CasC n=1 Tax=Nocardia colli TaxID=2545717 RepID=A0A5N0DZR7_9NOCA|nr:type I-E CRISPR-associated protein Cas7/Cse4/CasC [Nocardia colli]KAA8881880.1 type I-E CRISPR-associated protein Cas7/Cse4/CasC [Nocardia colli]
MTNTFVDVHILHSLPPSNVNRDDTGSPKHAQYGGSRRARVSSQAWKRATRVAMSKDGQGTPHDGSTRTKRIAALVAVRLCEQTGIDQEPAAKIANAMLTTLHISPGRRPSETAYLLYFGKAQVDRIVALVAGRVTELVALDDKALIAAVASLPVKEQLGSGHPVDVALFGRMIAEIPQLNVDAAVQVAHALSTHSVETEFDFYTAIDDEKPRNEGTGAEMVDAREFNSALYYRYASVGMDQLIDNLDGDIDASLQALQRFIPAFAKSLPGGNQNSFAHGTAPFLTSVVVRNSPVNLVSAFERPVHSDNGIAVKSAVRLAAEFDEVARTWGYSSIATQSTYPADYAPLLENILGAPLPFLDATSAVIGTVAQCLGGSDV